MSDPKKRKAYDHGGMEEVFHDFGDVFEHFNANSFFKDIFTHDDFFRDFGGGFGGPFMNDNHNNNNRQNNNNNNNGGDFGGGFGIFGGGNPFEAMFSSSFGDPFGGFGGGGGGGNIMSQSISTSYINGKKVTTKKMQKNGKTIIEKYENDQLVHKSINGQKQNLEQLEYNVDNKNKNKNKKKSGN